MPKFSVYTVFGAPEGSNPGSKPYRTPEQKNEEIAEQIARETLTENINEEEIDLDQPLWGKSTCKPARLYQISEYAHPSRRRKFLIDSGCSLQGITTNKDIFDKGTFKVHNKKSRIKFVGAGDENESYTIGVGDITVQLNKNNAVKLRNIQLVKGPKGMNILGPSSLRGCAWEIRVDPAGKNSRIIMRDRSTVPLTHHRGLPHVIETPNMVFAVEQSCTLTGATESCEPEGIVYKTLSYKYLHEMLGHASKERCLHFAKQHGIKVSEMPKTGLETHDTPCDSCTEARGVDKRSGRKSDTKKRREEVLGRQRLEPGEAHKSAPNNRNKILVVRGNVLEKATKNATRMEHIAQAAHQLALIDTSSIERGQLWQADFWTCELPGSEITYEREEEIEKGRPYKMYGNPYKMYDNSQNSLHDERISSSTENSSKENHEQISSRTDTRTNFKTNEKIEKVRNGIKFKLLFVDVLSTYTSTHSAKSKTQALKLFKEFVLEKLPALTRRPLKELYFVPAIQMDMDTAFKPVEKFLRTQGLPYRYADALNHRRNGVVERKQRTIPNMLRSTLFKNKTVPFQFWPIIFDQMVLIDNILPSRNLNWMNPYEALFQKAVPKSTVNMLHPIGKIAWIDVKVTKKKLRSRAKKAIYLGVADDDETLSSRSMIFAYPKMGPNETIKWYFLKRSLKQFRWTKTSMNDYLLREDNKYSEPRFSTWGDLIGNYVENISVINPNYEIRNQNTKTREDFPVKMQPARPVQRGIQGRNIQGALDKHKSCNASGIPLRSQKGTWGMTEDPTPEESAKTLHDETVAEALAEREAGTGLLPPARTRSSRKVYYTEYEDTPGETYKTNFETDAVAKMAYSVSKRHQCITKIFDDDERGDEYVASAGPKLENEIAAEMISAKEAIHRINLEDLEVLQRVHPSISEDINPAFVYAAGKKNGKRKRITKAVRNQYESDAELDKFYPPTSSKEASKRETRAKWKEAERREMHSLLKQNTFTLMTLQEAKDRHHDLEVLPSHPVYCVKKNGLYKHRQVCGARKQETVHNEVYNPTVRLDTFKMLCAASVQKGWHTALADFSNAYLHAEMPANKNIAITFRDRGILQSITEEIPKRFKNCHGEINSDIVGVLNKSLYGLANAGKLWGDLLTKTLKGMGLKRCTLDPCCYYSKNYHGAELYICVFVDDIAAFTTDTKAWQRFLQSIRKQGFSLTNGELTCFLGADVNTTSDGEEITLSQEAYVESMAIRFAKELKGVKAKMTPLPTKTVINLRQCPTDPVAKAKSKDYKFREMVGCLIWLAGYTRPDLLYPTQQLAQVMSNPTETHYELLKRVVAYAIITKDRCLTYKNDGKGVQIQAYVDANYNTDDTGRSNAGWIVTMSGASIMSSSKTIKTVATSSTHAEIHALFHCTKDVLWVRRLLEELGIPQGKPTPIYEDNTACLKFAETLQVSNRTKHLEIKYFHIKQIMNWGQITLIYIPTKDQIADALTKPLPYDEHTKFTDQGSGKTKLPGRHFNNKDMVLFLRHI
jgi:hypothetical protein